MDAILSQLPGTLLAFISGLISGVVLLLIGSRLRLFEQKDIRIANAKTDAKSKILNWAKECLDCLGEIQIKIYATILSQKISSEEEYKNFKKLETQGRLVLGFASILGGSIPGKTESCSNFVHEILNALANRDNKGFWENCPKLDSALSELIDSVTSVKL